MRQCDRGCGGTPLTWSRRGKLPYLGIRPTHRQVRDKAPTPPLAPVPPLPSVVDTGAGRRGGSFPTATNCCHAGDRRERRPRTKNERRSRPPPGVDNLRGREGGDHSQGRGAHRRGERPAPSREPSHLPHFAAAVAPPPSRPLLELRPVRVSGHMLVNIQEGKGTLLCGERTRSRGRR